jgi:hypothetical protein
MRLASFSNPARAICELTSAASADLSACLFDVSAAFAERSAALLDLLLWHNAASEMIATTTAVIVCPSTFSAMSYSQLNNSDVACTVLIFSIAT